MTRPSDRAIAGLLDAGARIAREINSERTYGFANLAEEAAHDLRLHPLEPGEKVGLSDRWQAVARNLAQMSPENGDAFTRQTAAHGLSDGS